MRTSLTCLLTAGLLGSATLAQTNTSSAWPPYTPTAAPIFQLSADSQFAFYLEEVLSLAQGGGSNTGEVLRIATAIVPSDFESTYTAFYYMAEHVHAIAESIDVSIDPVGARDAYFRAASYYRGSVFYLLHNWNDTRIYTLFDQALNSFNKAIALLEPAPGERFTVPTYSDNIGSYNTIGVFYKAKACDDEALPTVIVGGGYDSTQEESYHSVCRQVLARGINCVTYEGPGQPTTSRYQHIGFIPDWWTAASPIVDFIEHRSDVDASKIALVGLSFGGSLAPIAASRDDRYSALIAIDGLPSMRRAIEEQLPAELNAVFNSTNATLFDEIMSAIATNISYPTELRWLIDQSLFAFQTKSAYDWFTRLGNISITDDAVANTSIPVFIGKGQDDELTRNEPGIAYEMYRTGRPNGEALTTFHQFNTSLGAGEHCSLGAEGQLWAVVLSWLSGVWGNATFANTAP